MADYLLGIDLGTSSAKILLIDTSGKQIALEATEYNVSSPVMGYAEQDMELLWHLVADTIRRLLKKSNVDPANIKGIGYSGQMHGIVALDKNNKPIRPAIIWLDRRSSSQMDELKKDDLISKIRNITLNTPGTGFYLTSLLWLKEKCEQDFYSIKKAVLPKDYIRYKMCSEIATDITDASGTLLFNTVEECWSEELAARLDIPVSILPDVYKSYEVAGKISRKCADETGLKEGIPVVVGGGDNPMQAVGNGMIKPGIVCSNIGTGSQLSTIVTKPIKDMRYSSNTFCHVPENTWTFLGATLNGGVALKWLRDNILHGCTYADIDTYVNEVSPGSDGLIFVPYLAGERFPFISSKAKATIHGLTLNHNYKHLARAVMEGIIFSLRNALEMFNEYKITSDYIIASGGGAKSKEWLQIQADIFKREIYTTLCREEACMGAAITAGVGIGVYNSFDEACSINVKYNDFITEPNKNNIAIYDEQYEIFKQISTIHCNV